MGDSGAEDTSDSLTESDLDQIASDAEAIQEGGKSNIVGSSSYDAQFTADNLESRGLDPENFMAPENFAQTTQGGFTGGTGPQETTINVPSVGAASSTLAPGAFEESIVDTPSNIMLESAIGTTVPISNVSRETVVDRSPQGLLNAAISAAGSLRESYNNPIFQAAVEKADREQAEKSDLQKIQEALDAGTEAEKLDRPIGSIVGDDFQPALDMVDARTQDTSIVGDDFGPALDMVDARTTATGTTRGEDPFDPDVGRAFPVETLERAERLANEKTALERLGLPGFLSAVDPERVSRDLMATSLIAGRPIGAVEAIRGVQAPNLQKETMEEYRERTGARIPESQIITDDSGLVVGIKDAQGNLVTGMDPNAQEIQGDNDNIVRTKAPPKSPTDPCPDGYQLIDGKCTPTGATDTGTGFMMFPADRDPAFRRGPFTPTTVATTPNIQALNPVTFGLSNIFRR